MKQIVLNDEQKTIDVENILHDSFVGILWKDDTKSWVIKVEDECFKSVGIGVQRMDYMWSEISKNNYVENVITMGHRAFLFSTEEKLKEWLLKK